MVEEVLGHLSTKNQHPASNGSSAVRRQSRIKFVFDFRFISLNFKKALDEFAKKTPESMKECRNGQRMRKWTKNEEMDRE